MNKFIKEQLNKITVPVAELDNNVLLFKKQTSNNVNTDFVIGQQYNIRIEKYILNPSPTFTLASNWNAGTIPPEEELFVIVLQKAGNMIKFNCKGKTTGIQWEGWLPKKSITVL